MPKMVWSNHRAEMRPVKVRFSEWSRKKPKTDKDKILLKVWEEVGRVEARYRNKKLKKDKHGYQVYRDVKGWKYTFINKKLLEERHFVGAMLLRVGRKYFLFDIDRREVEHYRFNPFLTQLPSKAESIAEAYEMLKPKQVVSALKKGLKVQRQGEWFFIPTSKPPAIPKMPKALAQKLKRDPPRLKEFDLEGLDIWISFSRYGHSQSDDINPIKLKEVRRRLNVVRPKYRKAILDRVRDMNVEILKYKRLMQQKEAFDSRFNLYERGADLRAGNNTPNRVDKLLVHKGINYVKGRVWHTGREHEDLQLAEWHIAIPNTAINSFTIVGDID
jgi:hypothetical protein